MYISIYVYMDVNIICSRYAICTKIYPTLFSPSFVGHHREQLWTGHICRKNVGKP